MPGNSQYNGVPMFMVDADDFIYITSCLQLGKRLLSKNIKDDALRDYYIGSRSPKFIVNFNGLILRWI